MKKNGFKRSVTGRPYYEKRKTSYSGRQAAMSSSSSAESAPTSWIFSTPAVYTNPISFSPTAQTRSHKTHSELDVAGEVLDTLVLVQGALDKGRGDDTLLSVQSSDDRVGEQGTGCSRRVSSSVQRVHIVSMKKGTNRKPWRGWRNRHRPWPGRPLMKRA